MVNKMVIAEVFSTAADYAILSFSLCLPLSLTRTHAHLYGLHFVPCSATSLFGITVPHTRNVANSGVEIWSRRISCSLHLYRRTMPRLLTNTIIITRPHFKENLTSRLSLARELSSAYSSFWWLGTPLLGSALHSVGLLSSRHVFISYVSYCLLIGCTCLPPPECFLFFLIGCLDSTMSNAPFSCVYNLCPAIALY